MREIKFRAWAFNPVLCCYVMSEVRSECARYITDNKTYPNRVIMQFTGLKDKNGVEIFEGDIVREERGINEVKFEAYDSFQGYFLNTDDWSLEVIGNIYEHPHLLTEH